MRQFILTRFYDLPENADVMEAFNQFEKEQMQADMEEFAFDNQIDFKIVSDLVSAYTFSGNVSEDNIRERLMAYPLGLLKVTKLTKNVKRFIQDTYKNTRLKEKQNDRYKYIPGTGERAFAEIMGNRERSARSDGCK